MRFYAVFSVILLHLYPHTERGVKFFSTFHGFIPGVPLFFCISGFLITLILIDPRYVSRRKLIKSFYIRRFLRIFPIYYLTVLTLAILNINGYRQWALYDVFYLSNIIQGLNGDFSGSVAPHFWSLAVEEQFYLIWPGLVLLLRSVWYKILISAAIFGFGTGMMLLGEDKFLISKTVGCLTYLGSGAFLAVLWLNKSSWLKSLIDFFWIPGLVLLLMVVFEAFDIIVWSHNVRFLAGAIMIPLVTAKFAKGFEFWLIKRLVENPVILYLGKISYGLYVYHLLMLFPAVAIKKITGWHFLENLFAMMILKMILAIVVSIISWEFFEKKINKLKNRFGYN